MSEKTETHFRQFKLKKKFENWIFCDFFSHIEPEFMIKKSINVLQSQTFDLDTPDF